MDYSSKLASSDPTIYYIPKLWQYRKQWTFNNIQAVHHTQCIYGPRQANLVLIAYASSESRGSFRQKARSLAPLNGWACAVKICHDGNARRHKFAWRGSYDDYNTSVLKSIRIKRVWVMCKLRVSEFASLRVANLRVCELQVCEFASWKFASHII